MKNLFLVLIGAFVLTLVGCKSNCEPCCINCDKCVCCKEKTCENGVCKKDNCCDCKEKGCSCKDCKCCG